MSSASELFQSAIALHQRGQSDQAREQLDRVLREDPRHFGALQCQGQIAAQAGRAAQAVEFFGRAVAIDPSQAGLFGSLAEAHRALGRLDEAAKCYRQAVRLAPGTVAWRNNLGIVLHQAGLLDEAIASYQQALQLAPQNADLHFNLGCSLQQQKKLQLAAACYQKTLELNGAHRLAWINLGAALSELRNFPQAQACYQRALELDPRDARTQLNLGNAYQQQGQLLAATECYRRSLALDGDNVNAVCNLGNALREQGQHAEAVELLERAVDMRPDMAVAQSNLGVTYQDLGRLAEAQACLEIAVRLDPTQTLFQHNLGTILRDQGRTVEAIAYYDRALQLDPGNAQASCARGAARLQLGQFARGWADYEQRIHCPQFGMRGFPQPLWDGSSLGTRALLVHGEQGLGDTLQFIRYLRHCFAADDRIIVAVQPPLLPLLTQSGFRNLVSRSEPLPAFDCYMQLLSLPMLCRTELHTVPADVPYLMAQPARIEAWREKLREIPGRKIGIAWQGRASFRGDLLRSIPLESFAPLAAVPGVRLLSLQKGPGSEQIAAVGNRFEVHDLTASLDNEGAFLDTAAVMKNLDLVVTSDTSIAHLAGALGVPVWVALRVAPDWRWLEDRQDSPWYPTMRLFRQTRLGRWEDVFERMAEALHGELCDQ